MSTELGLVNCEDCGAKYICDCTCKYCELHDKKDCRKCFHGEWEEGDRVPQEWVIED